MATQRCVNGHLYDNEKNTRCPYCPVTGIDTNAVIKGMNDTNYGLGNPTVPAEHIAGNSNDSLKEIRNAPINTAYNRMQPNTDNENAAKPKTPDTEQIPAPPAANENTVGYIEKKKGFEPAVGWLVCIEGSEKGRDYRLKPEKNFIGRSSDMDVVISGDEGISRECHATVSYNPKKNAFKIYTGEKSRRLVYLNDEEVTGALDLKDRDIIELGHTKLMFVALCGGEFSWMK